MCWESDTVYYFCLFGAQAIFAHDTFAARVPSAHAAELANFS